MPMTSRLALAGAAAAVLALSACSHSMHAHHGGKHGAMNPNANASATTPAKVTASTPVLASGYKKVEAPATARLYFVNLADGATVSSPVKVVFGLSGMGVAPAGVEKAGTGHHHLLVNVNEWDANAPLPANDNFRHFGAGQTEVSLDLKPGQHTLQLVLGDQNHIPHHPVVMSDRITITVR
ncbi:DUF4399 domain-containing protein [Hydrogenophaga luteola]